MLKMKLYIAGESIVSSALRENLLSHYQTILPNQYDLDCIDILNNPESAYEDGILATPTLIKLSPGPIKKVIGDLTNMVRVQTELGIQV